MATFVSHKGSWGDRYLIEQPANKRVITCSNCTKYCEDGSCTVQPIAISEVGYNYWRHCKQFVLAEHSITEERFAYVKRIKGIKAIENGYSFEHQINLPSTKKGAAVGSSIPEPVRIKMGDKVTIREMATGKVSNYKMVKGLTSKPPVMVQQCLGKKRHDIIELNGVKYRIMAVNS